MLVVIRSAQQLRIPDVTVVLCSPDLRTPSRHLARVLPVPALTNIGSAMGDADQRTDDARLVAALASGDTRALRQVFDRHAATLHSLAVRILGDGHSADDVVQEVLVRLWHHPHRFDPQRGTLRGFLQRETHSRSIEKIRSDQARQQRETRHGRAAVAAPVDVETPALQSEQRRSIQGALAALTDGERRAVELAYLNGLSYREVAQRLQLPEGTVKSRIRAAMTKLAARLSDDTMGVRP